MLFWCRYNLATLRDIFVAQFAPDTKSPRYRAAQRRFTESMAGYSLVCYFLQIKVCKERWPASLPYASYLQAAALRATSDVIRTPAYKTLTVVLNCRTGTMATFFATRKVTSFT